MSDKEVRFYSQVCRDILGQQLRFQKEIKTLESVGVQLPRSFEVDFLHLVFDMFGFPRDGTPFESNMESCRFCRDYLRDYGWENVVNGEWTIEQFLKWLKEESHEFTIGIDPKSFTNWEVATAINIIGNVCLAMAFEQVNDGDLQFANAMFSQLRELANRLDLGPGTISVVARVIG